MNVVIPSRLRSEKIAELSLAIFPDAFVCVEDTEAEQYASAVGPEKLLLHPHLRSLAAIRNWIIANVPDEMFFMPDDDLTSVMSSVGRRTITIRDPEDVMQIVDNAGYIANEIGAGYFGFCQSARPYAFTHLDPINLNKWAGTAVGVIGKDILYDEEFSLHDDFDFSLQQLLKKRIIFRDERFFFESAKRLRSEGGNTAHRSSKKEEAEIRRLREKWGQYFAYYLAVHSGAGKANTHKTFSIAAMVSRHQR